jgi:hypothetical protein
MNDFEAILGDVIILELSIDNNGTQINSEDYLILFTVKKPFQGNVPSTSNEYKDIVIQKNNSANGGIAGQSNGKLHVVIDHADTQDLLDGQYDYDVQVARQDAKEQPCTVIKGKITFNPQITYKTEI